MCFVEHTFQNVFWNRNILWGNSSRRKNHKMIFTRVGIFPPESGISKLWELSLFKESTFSMAGHRKYALPKGYTFRWCGMMKREPFQKYLFPMVRQKNENETNVIKRSENIFFPKYIKMCFPLMVALFPIFLVSQKNISRLFLFQNILPLLGESRKKHKFKM